MKFVPEDFLFLCWDDECSHTDKSCDSFSAYKKAQNKLEDWLVESPTVYATKVFTEDKDESLQWTAPYEKFTEPLHGVNFATRKAKLVCIEYIKKPHHDDEHETP